MTTKSLNEDALRLLGSAGWTCKLVVWDTNDESYIELKGELSTGTWKETATLVGSKFEFEFNKHWITALRADANGITVCCKIQKEEEKKETDVPYEPAPIIVEATTQDQLL